MDWTNLRDAMPVTRRWAFFDHAAVAPITDRAQWAINEYAADQAENGDVNERRWVDRIEQVRRWAGQLIQADPLDVAFVKNTSEGIGIVAEGFPWQAGDNVVTAQEEYPANLYPWMNLQSRGVEMRLVASRQNRLHIDDIRAAIDSRTRIVSLSFVEFASGFLNDLDAVGAICRDRGVLFFVDAIQGLGVLPLDVSRSPIDFLAADGHKWLLGPEGAGILYVRRELLDRLHPVGVGWNSVIGARDFSRIDFRLKPHAGRYESGSHNIAGITGLGASLEMLLEIGTAKVASRIRELTDYLCERAPQTGLGIYSSRAEREWSGIVSLTVPDGSPRDRVKRCRDAGVVINQRAGRLRVSPHCYNTRDEIDRLMDLLGVTP